jgi:hypothetical protein
LITFNDKRPALSEDSKLLAKALKNFESGNYISSDLSTNARRRLSKCLDVFTIVAPERKITCKVSKKVFLFKLAFVILTISDNKHSLSDRYIVQNLLTPYLRLLKNRFGVINYVWKAEATKAGIIHFHIIIDNYIHHAAIRNTWNLIQKRHNLLDSYYNKKRHYNPNSTDIKFVDDSEKAQKYIAKYMSKQNGSIRNLDCKKWDATNELKNFKFKHFDLNHHELKTLEFNRYYNSYKYIEDKYFSINILRGNGILWNGCMTLKAKYESQFDELYKQYTNVPYNRMQSVLSILNR